MDRTPPNDRPNRDLYQWDGSDINQTQPGDGGVTQWREDAWRPPQQWQQPREYAVPRGDNNVNMIVYGDVYFVQGGGQGWSRNWQRDDGRCEYGGRAYDYRYYCAPYYRQAVPYYEYGYRQYMPQQGYQRSGHEYYYGGGYPQGGDYYRREGDYERSDIYGGPGGYRSSQERYRGGYEYGGGYRNPYGGGYRPGPYYDGGCFGGGGYGGYGEPGFDRFMRFLEFGRDTAFGVIDRDNARDATRWAYRSGRGDYGRGGGHYVDRGGSYGYDDRYAQWRQYRQRQNDFYYRGR